MPHIASPARPVVAPRGAALRAAALVAVALLAATLASACSTIPPDTVTEDVSEAAGLSGAVTVEQFGDPSVAGTYEYTVFRYGSPRNPRRPYYAHDRVAAVSSPVDVSEYIESVNESFWGYDATETPLNAIAWMPKGGGPYPLALVVHGNHQPWDYSEHGYDYLGRHLASRGIILVSVDENFLNGLDDENDARAIVLLEHLRQIRDWNEEGATPFEGKVDLERIALIGHSRGGSAVVHAAIFDSLPAYPENALVGFDYGFGIDAVVSIAPVEGQYRPAGKKLTVSPTVSYLSIHGTLDGDVTAHLGLRFFSRGTVEGDRFRSAITLYGANHAQFNTVWSPTQDPRPTRRRNLLSGEDQRRATNGLIAAFLETVFDLGSDYEPLFEDPRGAPFLPETLVRSQYRNGTDSVIADFDDDLIVSTTGSGWTVQASGFSVVRETALPLRGDEELETENWVLAAEVNVPELDEESPESQFVVLTPPGPESVSELLFDLALHPEEWSRDRPPIRLTLRSAEGETSVALNDLFDLMPTPPSRLLTGPLRYVVLQTVKVPIAAFGIETPSSIEAFSITVDADKPGSIYLDNVRVRP